MARAFLLVLMCTAVASASRYADYSGVKMPQYGADYDTHDATGPLSAADDYQARSPDAPAGLDYKYEEESNGKTETPFKEIADSDPWQPSRKQRGLIRAVGNDNLDEMDKYNSYDDMAQKLKSSHRFSKHRPRLKTRSQSRSDEPRSRSRYGRNRVDVSNRNDYLPDRDEFSDDKSKNFDDDVRHYNRRVTERIIRRKIRDRPVKSRVKSEILEDDDFLLNKRIEDNSLVDLEDQNEQMRPVIDDKEITPRPQIEVKPKANEEYNDYYDMKRVQNLKKKLPELLQNSSRRTTSIPRVAERELSALLNSHLQRKDGQSEIQGSATTDTFPPTFPPNAVYPSYEKEWNEFIIANGTERLQLSICVSFLALLIIKDFQR